MKVLHVSTPRSWRGGEQQAAYLLKALDAADVEVAILCQEQSVMEEKMKAGHILSITYPSRGWLNLSLAKKMAEVSKAGKFDIIHTHDSHAHSAAVIASTLFGNTTPVVVSRRVDFAVSSHPFSFWKYNHSVVKKIICVSEMIRRITAPSIKDPSKLCVIHSGIDVSAYEFTPSGNVLRSELPVKAEEKIVGNFSALADHKDYPVFLKTAMSLLKNKVPVHFVIAGTGDQEQMIRRFVESHQAGDRIHLLGFRKDIPVLMKALDVFLITSRTEGLGTIVLEAFAAGVPVVATRAGGIPELVEDEVTGLLADVGDHDGLGRAVLRIFEDEKLRRMLTDNAKRKVQDFSFRSTAMKTLRIYEEVLNP